MPRATFQSIILKLQDFWAEHGCLIAQPYYTQVGAGTMNPATFLRVLGPEPWNVAYVEPSVRPDDARYGENPNRFQLHYQFQVILKPDPGNPQELYLESLKAIGIDPRQHDIRFVEDNWEQPAISAWGLGWEVWLDGQEITQFTYFQQMGGVTLEPVSVELTYGLERILIALNNAKAIWDEPWDEQVTYGEIRRQEEFEHSKYYFEVADVERIRGMYDLFSAEAEACLAQGLIVPAHDYVLKCSHAFNVLDTRGAISVAERQAFFRRMRELARKVAVAYEEQRKQLEYPLLKDSRESQIESQPLPTTFDLRPSTFLLEIGAEELPAGDLDTAVSQLTERFPALLDELRLEHGPVRVFATPRRLAVLVQTLSPAQPDREQLVKGPPADKAFDTAGIAQPAALGFAKKNSVDTKDLQVREENGGRYVFAVVKQAGRTAPQVLAEALPGLVEAIRFEKSMRWNASRVAFSRPIRWFVALLGEQVIPFEYAGITSANVTRGLRPYDSPEIKVPSADGYLDVMREAGILLDKEERKSAIAGQVGKAAASVKGEAILDDDLLDEVANLVEMPTAFVGAFAEEYLSLPREVLISVMKKHQRYFPVVRGASEAASPTLLPYFVPVRNGDDRHLDLVRQGNEHVLNARFADASFFVREDLKKPLADYREDLKGLTFHTKLGSMFAKNQRIEKLVDELIPELGFGEEDALYVHMAATLAKADLATQMVTEMTSLQGIIGREYALRGGSPGPAAEAIAEQYQPVPKSNIGLALALADRIDSLVGLFAAGIVPSGAKDPFALRRAAIGVVQPLVEEDIAFDLRNAVDRSASLQPVQVSDEVKNQVLDFLAGRLAALLKDMGYRYDVVEAVLAEQATDPAGAARSVKQLQAWVERPDWGGILPAFARCVRILRSASVSAEQLPELNGQLLVETEEEALYKAVQPAIKNPPSSIDEFLRSVVELMPAINGFFDHVLVMADDMSLQRNRLALLQRIVALSSGLADMSRLEGY
jgi:glycyl-tRNA synthetase